ncbi:MAG TPA: hypothetical protein VGF84_11730 [Micromonosporaceae bacterium]
MTRMITAIGDRMLAAVLPRSTAGACVPEHGQSCSYTKNGHCTGGWFFDTVCTGRFACNGVCSNVTCVTRKVGPC